VKALPAAASVVSARVLKEQPPMFVSTRYSSRVPVSVAMSGKDKEVPDR
jgi:hypothetical protein